MVEGLIREKMEPREEGGGKEELERVGRSGRSKKGWEGIGEMEEKVGGVNRVRCW